jgi:transposase-like protein
VQNILHVRECCGIMLALETSVFHWETCSMQMKSSHRGVVRYTPEFRERALERLASGEASLRKVSRELGVSLPTLIKWRRQQQPTGPKLEVPAGRSSPALETIAELKLEIERLREERDRLRRGIAVLCGVPTRE